MPGQVGDLPHDTGKLLMWRTDQMRQASFHSF